MCLYRYFYIPSDLNIEFVVAVVVVVDDIILFVVVFCFFLCGIRRH